MQAREAQDRSGLVALHEARETGVRTLTTLGEQGEALDRAETVVDSNQYLIDKSGRVIRGMTWWGWVQNNFSSPPAPPKPGRQREVSKTTPERHSGLYDYDDDVAKPVTMPSDDQQTYVEELSRGLEDLMDVGVAIGARVDEQNETAPRLHTKLDRLWESTTHVTRQAGRVNEGYGKRAKPKLLGHVALRERETRKFLRARGGEVKLSDEVDVLRATCRFASYEKRAHLLGLQSCVSGKYMGITFGGSIACTSSSFGRWEEFDLDLDHRPTNTAILCVAANFGSGCWLRLTNYDSLTPGEPRSSELGLKRAVRFEIVKLDDVFQIPSYADQILVPIRRKHGDDDNPSDDPDDFWDH